MVEVKLVRYSEAFKRQVVSELESGRLRSYAEAQERYGIGGDGTISRWLRQYGKNHLLRRVIRVESPEERDQIRALKDRIKELERAVVDSKVQEALYKAYFEIACEQSGLGDPEAVKKRIAEKLSSGESGMGGGRRG